MPSKKNKEQVPDLVKRRPRKRRRVKRAPNVKRYYFTADTQRAIELYQSSNDKSERDKLYVDEILPAFDQLVENLICIYKFSGLYDSHEDLKSDCITFLYETLHKFDGTRGTKAFSYFNVVAKNWLIVRSKKRQQSMKRMMSLDAVDEFGRTGYAKMVDGRASDGTKAQGKNVAPSFEDKYVVPSQDDEAIANERITQLMKMFREVRSKLTNENEIKCIDSVITLFEQRDHLPMLNKRAVFTYIREMSGLTPKQLTMAISSIKKHYNTLKLDEDLGIF